MAGMLKKDSLHDLLRLIFRRKALLLVGASAFAIAALAVWHYVPLKYTGKAIFEFGLEAAAEEISRTSKESFGTIKERLAHDLAGPQAVEEAVRQLDLTRGLLHDSQGQLTPAGQASLQKMVEKFTANLDVVWEARSKQEDLVSVSFTHADPELAASVPNVLVKEYINRTYDRMRSGLKQQHDFLQMRVEDSNRQLDKALRERIEFETRHAGMVPENPSAFQEKIERANAELKAAKHKHETARLGLVRLNALRGEAGAAPTTAPAARAARIVKVPNPEVARLETMLLDVQDQIDTALTLQHMKEAHPTVRALRVKAEQTKRRLSEMPREVVKEEAFATGAELLELSMAAAAAQSEMDTAGNEITRLDNLLAEYDKAWANFSPIRQNYLSLLKKADDSQGEARHWRDRLQNVQIALAAAMDNRLTRLKAVQSARRQVLPSSPSLPLVLAVVVAGGLAFGTGLVFMSKLLDRTIHTRQEAGELFNLPVHGVIGEIITARQKARRKVKKWILAPASGVVILAALALASMSIVLRLRYPQMYAELWNSPYGFIESRTGQAPVPGPGWGG
ncbi:MAG TPA: hypothetical protein VM098_01595 [Phycisphaerae bacterium]|nr:hypothetical protein [Phycisphaerae bacterium]